MQIQHCESHAARYMIASDPQFFHWHQGPVSQAEFDGEGTAHCNSQLAFEDSKRMHVELHKIGRQRRTDTPEFATNDVKLRKTLLAFYETRSLGGGRVHRAHTTTGSDWNRLQFAQHRLMSGLPKKLAEVDRLCQEFVATSDTEQRRSLGTRIQALDSYIRTVQLGPGLFLRVATLYWRMGLNSCEVAGEVHFSPVFVRQSLHRLVRAWKRLQEKG